MVALRPELQSARAIVFDLDDTLCGYWQASRRAMAEAFRELASDVGSVEELTEAWATAFRKFSPGLKSTDWYPIYLKLGEPTRTEQMRLMLAELGHDDPTLAAKLSNTYAELRDRYLALFPEARQILDQLADHFPLALMTNGPADIQRQEIATLGIAGYFRHIFIEGELGEGKPNESVFRRAEGELGFSGDEILMIGNSYHHDICPALDRGWLAAWVRRPTDVAPSAREPERRPEDSPAPTIEIADLGEIFAG